MLYIKAYPPSKNHIALRNMIFFGSINLHIRFTIMPEKYNISIIREIMYKQYISCLMMGFSSSCYNNHEQFLNNFLLLYACPLKHCSLWIDLYLFIYICSLIWKNTSKVQDPQRKMYAFISYFFYLTLSDCLSKLYFDDYIFGWHQI